MARRKTCQRCPRPAAVEVTYVFGKGEPYRFADAVCQKPEGVTETGVLCEPCATAAIASDDPPWSHTWFSRPKRERVVDETPRFSESWGLA